MLEHPLTLPFVDTVVSPLLKILPLSIAPHICLLTEDFTSIIITIAAELFAHPYLECDVLLELLLRLL